MKLKFITLLLILNVSIGLHAAGPETIEQIKMILNSANTVTFSKDNLLVVRINAEDEGKWKEALNYTKEFVTKKQTSLKLTTPVVDYLNPVINASNDIFNALNSAYTICIKLGIKSDAKKNIGLSVFEGELVSFEDQLNGSAISAACIDSKIGGLKRVRETVLKSFNDLKNKTIILSSEDAREAVYLANFIIRQVIDKIFRDFDKMKTRIGK